MIESRFIRLYLTLSPKELKEVKLWINSPMHNQHQNVIKLFDFLASRKKITARSVQKKRAFEYIFKGEKYKEQKLSHVMNYALNTLKNFFGYKETISDEFSFNKKLITSLQQRSVENLALLELKKLDKITTRTTLQNASHSLHLFELERTKFELEGTQNRSSETNLPQIFKHLTDFYYLSILKYACIARTHSNIAQQDYNIQTLKSILDAAQQSKHPIIQLYYNIYLCLDKPQNKDYFYQASTLFLQHFKTLEHQEQHEILVFLTNYCIRQLNKGEKEHFTKEAFKWFVWGLENKVLIYNNTLSRFGYVNIIGLALKLKEFDWAFSFIEEYTQYIPEEFRENYQHYSTATVFFRQKNYQEAQSLLRQIEQDDIFLNLDTKGMLLEIYYEEKNWIALDALLISFSRYLQRKQVIIHHKQAYQHLILFTRKLMAIAPYDEAAKQQLIDEIKTTKLLTTSKRDWLLEQAKKL